MPRLTAPALALLLAAACSIEDPFAYLATDAGMDAIVETDGEGASCRVRCGPAADCCADDEECVVDRCAPTCNGSRCGAGDDLCCTGSELCFGGGCVEPGARCAGDADCPAGEICEPLVSRCLPTVDADACRFTPPIGTFEPVVQWEWTDGDVTTTPIVAPGLGDPPRTGVVFVATLGATSRVVALDGSDGSLLWIGDMAAGPICRETPAAADVDGDGTTEVFAIAAGPSCNLRAEKTLVTLSHTGERIRERPGVYSDGASIVVADLDADGTAESIVGGCIYDDAGAELGCPPELLPPFRGFTMPTRDPRRMIPSVADLDGDGRLEIAEGNVALRFDPAAPAAPDYLWQDPMRPYATGFTAVGRVQSLPGTAHLVHVEGGRLRVLDALDGSPLVESTFSGAAAAGPPTLADFDGDGVLEAGVVTETGLGAPPDEYIVLELDPGLDDAARRRWAAEIADDSVSAVGSTVFDFDGDGAVEVLYQDDCHVYVRSGSDGTLLAAISNTSRSTIELPVVADVDRDGNAEVVVASVTSPAVGCDERGVEFTGPTRGLRVFRDRLDHWLPTRSVWNQHAYHVDNVRDDATLPAPEPAVGTGHNSWRQNVLLEPEALTLAPNLVVAAVSASGTPCPGGVTLRARLENRGARGVGSGVPVAFYLGEPGTPARTLIGVTFTGAPLLPGSGVWLELPAGPVTLDENRRFRFHAVADDDGTDSGPGTHSECDELDNTSPTAVVDCSGPT